MKAYEEIAKEVDKDFECYTLEDKILAEYEKSKVESKYLVETMANREQDVEFYDTLDDANWYAEQHYSCWTESEKKTHSVHVGYVEKTTKYYDEDWLDEEDFDWYGYHSHDVPDGAFDSEDIKEFEALKKRIVEPCADDSLYIEDMEDYGYKFVKSNQMLPITDEFAKELYCYGVEIYRLYSDDTEGLVESMEEIKSHIECGGMFGIESKTWDSVKDKLDELKDSFIHTIEVKKDYFEKISIDEFELYQRVCEEQLDVIPAPHSRGR